MNENKKIGAHESCQAKSEEWQKFVEVLRTQEVIVIDDREAPSHEF